MSGVSCMMDGNINAGTINYRTSYEGVLGYLTIIKKMILYVRGKKGFPLEKRGRGGSVSHLRVRSYRMRRMFYKMCNLDKNKDLLEFSCEKLYKKNIYFFTKIIFLGVSETCRDIFCVTFFGSKYD